MRLAYKDAIAAIAEIENCYHPGLKALGSYSAKIKVSEPRALNGSLFLEECLKNKYAGQNLWDYCLGYKNQAYFIEVHPAQTSEVETMLKKLNWLKNWLQTQAKPLNQIKAKNAFIWIASGKFGILSGSQQFRRIVEAGIKPQRELTL
jgi:hypothetical protein